MNRLTRIVLAVLFALTGAAWAEDPGPEELFRKAEARLLREDSIHWKAAVDGNWATLLAAFEPGGRFSLVEKGSDDEKDLPHLRCDGTTLREAGGWEGATPKTLSADIRRMLARWGTYAATETAFKAEAERLCSKGERPDEAIGGLSGFRWGKEDRGVDGADGHPVRIVEYDAKWKGNSAPGGLEGSTHRVWIDTRTLAILKRVIAIRGGTLTETYDYGAAPEANTPSRDEREALAEKTLERLVDAEIFFRKDLKHGAFAWNLGRLRTEGLFKDAPSGGYLFGALETCDPGGGTDPKSGYAYYAVPEAYGKAGRRTYIVNQGKCVYFRDTGNAVPPKEWPRDLAKEGWVKLAD